MSQLTLNPFKLWKDSQENRIYRAIGPIAEDLSYDLASPTPSACDHRLEMVKKALEAGGIQTKVISIEALEPCRDLGHMCGTPQYSHLVNLVGDKLVCDPPWGTAMLLLEYLKEVYKPKSGITLVAKDGDGVIASYQHA